MNQQEVTKSQPVSKLMVWKAYKGVKRNGGSAGVDKRALGIPTVSDRIAQMVVKNHLEPMVDKEFSNSRRYRPDRSAHDAVSQAEVHGVF